MISTVIANQTRHHVHAERTGARRRWLNLCLATGVLLCLMGCGYAGQPNTPGSHGDSSASVLQATPSLIAFGNVVSGQPYSQTVRLSNSGTADLTIMQVKTSGAGFSTSGLSLPLTLPAGQSAIFSAAFMATKNGSASGGIAITSDVAGSRSPAMTIGMSATVVSALTQLTPSSSSVNFGNGVVGVAETQNVTLTNTGNSNVSISAVSASGVGFSASGAANVTLTPTQTVSVSITFDAASTGAAAGNLMVSSDGAALQIALAGTGVNARQHSVALQWNPSTSSVAGYYVYRGDGLNGPLSKLISSTTPTTNYTDTGVMSGQSYNYAVTSVDSDNVESTFSNESSVTIPTP